MPSLNLDALRGDVDVDLLMGDKKLASLEAVDEAEKIGTDRLNKLETGYAKGNFGPRYKKVKDGVKGISFNSKNPKKLRESLSALKRANESAKSLGRDVKKYSSDTKAGYKAIKAGFKNIDRKIDEDLASIKSLANLGDLDASKIGQILFGQGVLDQFNWIMGKVRLAKDMLGSDDDSAEIEPERRAGRIITYPVTGRAYPTFLVESTGFTGFTSAESGNVDLNYSGTMTGLSSNARVYGKPLIIEAKAGRSGKSTWAIRGNFDHTKSLGKDSILISGRKVDLGEFKMAGGDLMPQKAVANNGTVNIDFGVSGNRIQARMRVVAKRLNFVFEEKAPAGDKLAGIIRDLFKGIKNADVSATLSGTFSDPKFNIKSSIDEIFWQRTKQIFKQRVAETNRKLRKKIKDRVNKKRATAEAKIKARQAKLTAKFNKVKKQADVIKTAYAKKKKAGEAKLRAALKSAGGDKLKGKLKKLFN
jgi:uncharacterized protein (TIGR03545 family)